MNAAPWRGRVVGAALELNQQADTERRTTLASAATPERPDHPRRRRAPNQCRHRHRALDHAAAVASRASGLLSQADTTTSHTADGQPAGRGSAADTAAQNYPVPVAQATRAQAQGVTIIPTAAPAGRHHSPVSRRR